MKRAIPGVGKVAPRRATPVMTAARSGLQGPLLNRARGCAGMDAGRAGPPPSQPNPCFMGV